MTERPMIENSDRGITLSKPLAWAILSSLAVLIWWGSTTVTSLQTAIATLTVATSESRGANTAMDARMRTVENAQTRVDATLNGMQIALQEIKEQNRAIEQLFRQYLQAPKP